MTRLRAITHQILLRRTKNAAGADGTACNGRDCWLALSFVWMVRAGHVGRAGNIPCLDTFIDL